MLLKKIVYFIKASFFPYGIKVLILDVVIVIIVIIAIIYIVK